MHRSKIIKKSTKHRETLLRNLRKGRARLEERATFQLIPYPMKFSKVPQMHRLYADLVLIEQDDTMISDISFCNNFKYYKNAQVVEGVSQKIVKYQVENKVHEYEDWRLMVENLQRSELDSMQQWAELIKNYCERYETVMKEFQQGISIEKIHAFSEINAKREKARQTILNTYPCMEIKSQLKDGRIQLTEVSYSEKYLAELGYTVDEYTSLVLKEGLPLNVPVDGQGASWIAKMRLEKSLNTDLNGYQTSELESCVMMKNGFLKKVKCKVHYYSCFEKGVPGFVIIGAIVARQKPSMSVPKPIEGLKISPEFVDFMIKREKEHAKFMWEYYDLHLEQKYTNLHKVCKIRDLGVQ